MRINVIGNFKQNTGLQQDANILRGLLSHIFGEKLKLFKVPYILPECGEAEVNIFIEVMNPSLIPYAAKNVWIPNLEWTYQTWAPYVTMMDEIWTKTTEATKHFSMLAEGTQTKVTQIHWTSEDKTPCIKKNYSKAIVLVGKNIYRNPKQLLRAYAEIKKQEPTLYSKLPVLHIPYHPDHMTIYSPPEIENKVKLLASELKQEQYDELLADCGLAICLSAAEGYGHAINEAMSSGCNLLLSPISPFKDLCSSVLEVAMWTEPLNISPNIEKMGYLVDSSVPSIVKALKEYCRRDISSKKVASELIRTSYEIRHYDFIHNLDYIRNLYTDDIYSMKNKFPKEEDLPDISIVTLTKDRRVFMPLAKYSYLIQCYPADKLEWVIVDDGEDSIEDTLVGIPNVVYVRCSGLTIGEKRNLGIEKAMYDILVMMDDDDVYPNNSVLHRVAMMLKEPAKQCAFCTTIPCYDIVNYTSFMNVPPITLHMSERVSEASLVFTRKFWEDTKFDNSQIAEGNAFIHGRESMCRELSPQEVIVSLVHPKNTSSRKIPITEPNGCHYGFNEKLFAVVSEIGETLKAEHATETAGTTATTATS
jgi:hypothetical protein